MTNLPVRAALVVFVTAVMAIGAAYGATLWLGAAPAFAPWALAYGSGAAMAAVFALGATRAGKLSATLVVAFVLVFVVVSGSFALALGLPAAEGAGGPMLLGLPRRTAIVLYGVGVLPMFLLPLLYAFTFDRGILTEADIARVRAARRARVAAGAGDTSAGTDA
ncbi:MAG: hypothetical protein ABIZ91_03360 [Gemmatimonadaceae bacterium]